MKFKALIVGAGNIGATYDQPDSAEVLTHAHAYAEHGHFRLGGFVDTDAARLNSAVRIWGGKAYRSVEEAFSDGPFDVVSVAVPTHYHFAVMKRLLKFGPKVIFAEKPFVSDMAEYRALKGEKNFNRVAYCLNYRRRFVREIRALRDKIRSGGFGPLVCGTGYYGKGFFHNGTHLLDMLNFLIGDFSGSSLFPGVADHSQEDPSCSVLLAYPGGARIYVHGVDSRLFTVFELDLLFQKGRVRISDIGNRIEEFTAGSNSVYKGYRFLNPSRPVSTSLSRSLLCAVDNIYGFLTGREDLLCTQKDAEVLFRQLRRIFKRSKVL